MRSFENKYISHAIMQLLTSMIYLVPEKVILNEAAISIEYVVNNCFVIRLFYCE